MESTIRKKIERGERITDEEALWLLTRGDVLFMGEMAEICRTRAVGTQAFYQFNVNINHTNICKNQCGLCAFYRDEKEGYVLSLDDIERAVKTVHDEGVNEVHIVGGLNDALPFDYFRDMMCTVKGIDARIHIQAFTPVEIDFFAAQSGLTTREVLAELQRAGLNTLPGGGAEIFSGRVRDIICPNKIRGEEWLRIMEEAHMLGIHSNATMLYGHVETPAEIVDHMSRLRSLQDRTNGFYAFVPLTFFPAHTTIQRTEKETFGILDMKILSLARMYLDNFPHLKSLWMIYGYKACQVGLDFGSDDIGGTYYDEIIVHSAGAKTPKSLTKNEICALITAMGRVPVEVTSCYEPVNTTVGVV